MSFGFNRHGSRPCTPVFFVLVGYFAVLPIISLSTFTSVAISSFTGYCPGLHWPQKWRSWHPVPWWLNLLRANALEIVSQGPFCTTPSVWTDQCIRKFVFSHHTQDLTFFIPWNRHAALQPLIQIAASPETNCQGGERVWPASIWHPLVPVINLAKLMGVHFYYVPCLSDPDTRHSTFHGDCSPNSNY